jgi:hypothetical protein
MHAKFIHFKNRSAFFPPTDLEVHARIKAVGDGLALDSHRLDCRRKHCYKLTHSDKGIKHVQLYALA